MTKPAGSSPSPFFHCLLSSLSFATTFPSRLLPPSLPSFPTTSRIPFFLHLFWCSSQLRHDTQHAWHGLDPTGDLNPSLILDFKFYNKSPLPLILSKMMIYTTFERCTLFTKNCFKKCFLHFPFFGKWEVFGHRKMVSTNTKIIDLRIIYLPSRRWSYFTESRCTQHSKSLFKKIKNKDYIIW